MPSDGIPWRSGLLKPRGQITYDDQHGHVCTCTAHTEPGECEGHPAGPFDPMGETFYCDGSCNAEPAYAHTVNVDRDVEPTESGSYWYVCSRCGAGGWSGL